MRNIKDIHGWVTVRDAAQDSGITVERVLRMIVERRIRYKRLGVERLVQLEEVRAEVRRRNR